MIEGFTSSNELIKKNSNDVLLAFQSRLNVRENHELAEKWLPKAKKVERLSNELNDYIELVKAMLLDTIAKRSGDEVMIKLENSKAIYEKLQVYKKDLLNIDSSIADEFKDAQLILTDRFIFLEKEKGFTNDLFSNVSTMQAVAILAKIQNNIRITEFKLLRFSLNRTSEASFCNYGSEQSDIISTQSVTHARPGESIEIMAGHAVWIRSGDYKIFIAGKEAKQDFKGKGTATIKASNKTGKHSVPVTVEWVDWKTGQKKTFTEEIVYYVDSIPSKQ